MSVALQAFALAVGCLLAIQASANQQLNKEVGTPYGASTLQLSVACATLVVLATGSGAIGDVTAVRDVHPWWLLTGGVASPLYITAGILLFPRLGALAAGGLFVTGQVFASLALDTFGWLSVPEQSLTAGIALGVGCVLAGITVVIRSQAIAQQTLVLAGASGAPVSAPVRSVPALGPTIGSGGWIVLGVLAGAVLPLQGAVNARLHEQIDASMAVALVSFAVATATIAIALAVMMLTNRSPAPRFRPLATMPWWGWLGGFCAAAYVTATFLLIPEIGAAVTVTLTVTGQQLASAAVDHYGWMGMPRRPFSPVRASGLVLLVVGSALVQLA